MIIDERTTELEKWFVLLKPTIYDDEIVINTQTQDEYNEVMEYLESHNYKWLTTKVVPTKHNYWNQFKKETTIDIDRIDKTIVYGLLNEYSKNKTIKWKDYKINYKMKYGEFPV